MSPRHEATMKGRRDAGLFLPVHERDIVDT